MGQSARTASEPLESDDTVVAAHVALRQVGSMMYFDYASAETEFKTASSHYPNYATAHHWLAIHYLIRANPSAIWYGKALELDPLSLVINSEFRIHII